METETDQGTNQELECIVSQERIERAITAILAAGAELGCNRIELAHACRSVSAVCTSTTAARLARIEPDQVR